MLPDKRACNIYHDIIRCDTPPPDLNSANIHYARFWGQTTKFKDHEYFWLCGIYVAT